MPRTVCPALVGYTNHYATDTGQPDGYIDPGASGFASHHYANDPIRQSWRKHNNPPHSNGVVGGASVYNGMDDERDYSGVDNNGYPHAGSNGYAHQTSSASV